MRNYEGLEWTTDGPYVEGWYWAKHNDRDIECVRVYYCRFSNELEVDAPGYDSSWVGNYYNWFGPIPVPDMPEGEMK